MTAATTETTELAGGPYDGNTLPYVRPAGADMPLVHPVYERYELAALETRTSPQRWRYRWVPERPARARTCPRCNPPRRGCPGYRAESTS